MKMRLLFVFLLTLVTLVKSLNATQSSEFGVLNATNKGFIVVPLSRHKGVSRRNLLRQGYLPVGGSVREPGYFYTDIKIGTPPRTFNLIIDTGSTITYVPCINCKHCGKHNDAAFNPNESSTLTRLKCSDPGCQCGSPQCTCTSDKMCYYKRNYAEQSSSEGWMMRDLFAFPDGGPGVEVTFGCENGETGEIYRQKADGLLGLGQNTNAFQNQLARAGVMDGVFSLCFGYPDGGTLLLGSVPLPPDPPLQYSPLLSLGHHYYNIEMAAVSVAGKQLELPKGVFSQGYGTLLDSGTTFTYLPTKAFEPFRDAVIAAVKLTRTKGADPQYDDDICWRAPGQNLASLDNFFPAVEFLLGGGARLRLPPLRYVFMARPDEFCLGVLDNGISGALIGSISVRNLLVQYDVSRSRIGFRETDCTALPLAIEAEKQEKKQAPSSPLPDSSSSPPAASPALAGGDESTQASDASPTSTVASPPPSESGTAAPSDGDHVSSASAAPSPPPATSGGGSGLPKATEGSMALSIILAVVVLVAAAVLLADTLSRMVRGYLGGARKLYEKVSSSATAMEMAPLNAEGSVV